MMEEIIQELLNLEDEIEEDIKKMENDLASKRTHRMQLIRAQRDNLIEEANKEKEQMLLEAERKAAEIGRVLQEQTRKEKARYDEIYQKIHQELVEKYFNQIIHGEIQ